jgi:ribosomal protein S18 acetylase RimI-like enzyme
LGTELNYRKANEADFEQLKALGKEAYSEFVGVLSKENRAKMHAFLESDSSLKELMKQSTVFVCERNTSIVGMIYLVPSGNPTKLFQKEWSYIRFLGVSTSCRGKGIGKQLTEHCIDYARGSGERYIALHTAEFMGPARAIYEKQGFRKGKEIEHFGKRYWIYLLELDA